MEPILILARVLHVGLGVFWAGAMIFNAVFLLPAMGDAGPDGAKVGAALFRRRFADVLPVTAIITVLSGFYLYWYVSGGFGSEYMGSRMGITYGLGSVAALLALILGLGIMRPSMLRAVALSQSAGAAAPPERDSMLAEAARLRARAGSTARVIAWLLAAAVVTMAVARYL